MRLNEEQKKIVKSYLFYSVVYLLTYPVIDALVLGHGFTRGTLHVCLGTILGVGVINIVLILRARNRNNK